MVISAVDNVGMLLICAGYSIDFKSFAIRTDRKSIKKKGYRTHCSYLVGYKSHSHKDKPLAPPKIYRRCIPEGGDQQGESQ